MKKSISLILAVLMLFGLLAGCADAPATTTEPDTTTTTEPATTDTPAEEPAEEPVEEPTEEPVEEPTEEPVEEPAEEPATEPAEVFIGIADPNNPNPNGGIVFPLTEEPVTVSAWSYSQVERYGITDLNDLYPYAKMEELSGVHIDWQLESAATAKEKFNLSLVSGDYYDTYWTRDTYSENTLWVGGYDKYIEDEIIIDLAEMVPEYAPNYYALMNYDETTRRQTVTDAGSVPMLRGFNFGMTTEPTFIGYWARNDILKQMGMDYSTINTVDEYETMLAGMTEYLDGPLLVDATGFESGMLCAYSITSTWMQRDGKAVYCPYDDAFRDYLTTMNRWYEAGYVSKDFTNSDSSIRNGYMYNESGLFRATSNAGRDYPKNSAVEGYELVPLYYPVLEDGMERTVSAFVVSTSYVTNGNVTISTACETPELMLQWLDYWFTQDGFLLGNYGIEGESWEWNENGEPQLTDMMFSGNGEQDGATLRAYYISQALHPKLYRYGLTNSEEQVHTMVDIWESNYNPVNAMPEASLLTEESEEYAPIYNNVNTYVAEMTLKFITGGADIDTEWETYKAELEAMGVDTMIELYQGALDRYYAK